MGLRVLVCGGRNFNDAMTLGSWLGGIHKSHRIDLLIHGAATGADTMAEKFGEWAGIPTKAYPADWKAHGKAAGPIRNAQMLEDGRPDIVVAFEGGRGTADMIAKAERAGIPVTRADRIVVQ